MERSKAAARMTMLAAMATASIAVAQTYPSKPIRFIVSYPAGGPADTVARMVGQQLASAWGQSVVIDNRGGGGGVIAAELGAKAPPDGHTLLLGAIQTHAINPGLFAKLPYDPVKDFVAVTPLSFDPLLFTIIPAVPATNLKELMALARAKPGSLNYASTGTGGSSQLAMELLKSLAGVNIIHVPYKGAAPAIIDLLAGQVHATFLGISATLPHARAGRLRAMGVTSAKRSAAAPDIPSIAEQGFPGFEVVTWYGVVLPAGTPAAIVNKLHGELMRILKLPEVRDRLAASGAEAVPMAPEEFARFIQAERTKWTKVIRDANIKAD